MIEVERSFEVDRPLPAVVAYLSDFSRAVDWDPGTRECTRTDDGPVAVGSQWHNVSEFRGRTTELTYRLDRLDDDRLTFHGTNSTADSTDDLSFEEAGAGTLITYRATIRFKGLARFADPFLRRTFEGLGDEITVSMPKATTRAVA